MLLSQVYGTKNIIDSDDYIRQQNIQSQNGRVNILNDPSAQFAFFEKVSVKNKASEYRDALTGVWENSTLSRLYFSSENLQIIQNGIRAGVYKMSKNEIVVAPQNVEHVKIIMRTYYLEHARHLKDHITEQIQELNKYVLDYCVPFVYNESVAYLRYLEDSSTLVVPLERSKQPDRDFKQLQYKTF